MQDFNICLNSVEDVGDFITAMEKADIKGELSHGLYSVNARSLMGILSMDLSNTLRLRISNKESLKTEKIIDALYKYISCAPYK